MKITIMGEEVSADELPEPPAPELGDYFAPVILAPRAIDRASQVVPEEVWKPAGLHTWLSKRANEAYGKLKVGELKIRMGRLEYQFEHAAEGPVLKTVMLV